MSTTILPPRDGAGVAISRRCSASPSSGGTVDDLVGVEVGRVLGKQLTDGRDPTVADPLERDRQIRGDDPVGSP